MQHLRNKIFKTEEQPHLSSVVTSDCNASPSAICPDVGQISSHTSFCPSQNLSTSHFKTSFRPAWSLPAYCLNAPLPLELFWLRRCLPRWCNVISSFQTKGRQFTERHDFLVSEPKEVRREPCLLPSGQRPCCEHPRQPLTPRSACLGRAAFIIPGPPFPQL